jgi:hypothetical protein
MTAVNIIMNITNTSLFSFTMDLGISFVVICFLKLAS